MNPVTHLFMGWCTASVDCGLSRRDRTLITLAAVIPDADGLGAIPELLTRQVPNSLLWYSEHHHSTRGAAIFVAASIQFHSIPAPANG